MLITRANKGQPAPRTNRTHIAESRQRNVITETANDPHSVIVEQQAMRNQIVRKWAPVLNKCKELTGPGLSKNKIGTMATVFENTLKSWSPKGRNRVLFEAQTTTADIADFTRFALPMLRKSFSRLISDNLVGVQAMNQPASMIFYIRYRYALTKGQTQAGTQIMRQSTAAQYARNNGWALDPYYSSQEVHGEDATINGAKTLVSATLVHRPVLAGTVVVEVYDVGDENGTDCDEATPCLRVGFGAAGTPDVVVVGDCTDFTATLTVDVTTPGATVFNHATGAVQVTLSNGSFPTGAKARVNYEYDLEANPFQPEVTLSIDSDSVTAITRKLKTSWSLEASQDMHAVHNLDPEQLMTDLMADEMVAEIDREIINDLIVAAAIRASHNFATAAGASVNFTDRNIALLYKTLEVANIIHRTTLRGPANWAVTSADIASKFEQLNDFRASDAMTQEGVDVGITNSGTIQGKLRLYKDPLFPNCKILLGFKGNSVLDAGYFYAPYIPLLATPTITDPNSFTPNKGVMCRYGKKLIEDGSLYYGVIKVSNL